MIRRFYVTLDARQVHVMTAGQGPALVMLHAPPLWSRTLEPLITRLAASFTVVAPDLAGYGLSDALPDDAPTAAAYAQDVGRVLDRLGVTTFALYAEQESDAIAAVLADRRAGKVSALVLDDPLVLSGDEQASLLARGLPDLEPEASGGHLLRTWDAARARYMFRPAHEPRLANRLDRNMASPAELDEIVKCYMRAGPGHGAAIRAALGSPLARSLPALSVPLLVLANERVDAARLPGPGTAIQVQRVPFDPARRADAIGQFLRDRVPGDATRLRVPAHDQAPARGFSRLFIPVPGGDLHARANFSGTGRPVLAMHDPAGSHALVLPFVNGMLGTRPVIALDMPGNGESDNTVGTRDVTPADYARAVIEALDSLGFREVDVIGRYSGGPIGMEMSFQRPALVAHLVQAAIDLYRPQHVADVMANYTPSIAPQRDGSHLVLAWFNMMNQALYWPWFWQTREGIVWGEPQVDPQLIQQRVFDLLRVGDMYQQAYAAMWNYPMERKLPQTTVPTLLCAPRWDPIYAGLDRAARIAPASCTIETLPDRFADWASVFMRFFDEDRSAPPA